MSDLLWNNPVNGQTMAWFMNGIRASSSVALLGDPAWKVIKTADFDGDSRTDLILYNETTGQTVAWIMNGNAVTNWTLLPTAPDWKVTETADLNGDGKTDLLLHNASNGQTAAWLMNGSTVTSWATLIADADWQIIATADLNGDQTDDLIWSNTSTGQTAAWLMNGTNLVASTVLLTASNWKVIATADFNGDQMADLLWYNVSNGLTAMWLMSGTSTISWTVLPIEPNWKLAATADLNGDGKADIIGVTFGDASSPTTTANFSSPGTYTLRLTAGDSSLIATDDVIIAVASPANQAPVVNAGPDQVVTYPSAALLAGTATDDGLPTGSTLNRAWTKVSGPGTVTLVNMNSLNTSATFSLAGSYTLRLTVSDGSLSVSDDMIVTVGVQQACGDVVSGSLTLSANAADNVGVVGVQLKLDGANLGAELKTAPYSIPWNTTTVLNGCHTLSAVARDAAGNQGSTSLQATILSAVVHQEIGVPTEKSRSKNVR